MNTLNAPVPLMRDRYLDFFEPSYARRLLLMLSGLRQPRSSCEHRAAVIELQRLSVQATTMLLTLLAVGLLLLTANDGTTKVRDFEVQWGATTTEPVKSRTEEAPPPERPPDAKAVDAAAVDAAALDACAFVPNAQASTEAAIPALQAHVLPTAADSLLPIKCMPAFKRISGDSRAVGVRTTLLTQNGGTSVTEESVLRALRWLKKNQQADGSWNSQKIAMTSLAVLTFLAHDERPAYSPEFGTTVQKALEFLMGSQKPDGHFAGADGNEYAHPIATYALCEAYGMTLNPNIKAAAEKALVPIIKGQHPTGGWTYKMDPGLSKEEGRYRDDTSYMGWCAQALKAAKLATLHADGLDKALKLTVKGFQNNAHPNGGFGYTAPGQGGLTGVGTLCMQLLGAADRPEVKKSLALMDSWKPSFDAKNPIGGSVQYACYYATQAKFHAGGKAWSDWNKEMTALYLRTQRVEKGALKDNAGRDVEIGWWVNGDAHSDRPVMDTCLVALQLMVYYRTLPTTSLAAVKPPEETLTTAADKGDILIMTGNL